MDVNVCTIYRVYIPCDSRVTVRSKEKIFSRASTLKNFLEHHKEATGTVSRDVRVDNFLLNTVSKNNGPSSNDQPPLLVSCRVHSKRFLTETTASDVKKEG